MGAEDLQERGNDRQRAVKLERVTVWESWGDGEITVLSGRVCGLYCGRGRGQGRKVCEQEGSPLHMPIFPCNPGSLEDHVAWDRGEQSVREGLKSRRSEVPPRASKWASRARFLQR